MPCVALLKSVIKVQLLKWLLFVETNGTIALFTDQCMPRFFSSQYKHFQIIPVTMDSASPLHLLSIVITDIPRYMTSDVVVSDGHCKYCQANIKLGACIQDKVNIQVNIQVG